MKKPSNGSFLFKFEPENSETVDTRKKVETISFCLTLKSCLMIFIHRLLFFIVAFATLTFNKTTCIYVLITVVKILNKQNHTFNFLPLTLVVILCKRLLVVNNYKPNFKITQIITFTRVFKFKQVATTL